MIHTQAMFFYGLAMFPGSIAFIFLPTVMRKFNMQLSHEIISVSFGENTGRRDGRKFFIALYDALMRNIPVPVESITVDQQQPWFLLKLFQCKMHGFKRGVQNID